MASDEDAALTAASAGTSAAVRAIDPDPIPAAAARADLPQVPRLVWHCPSGTRGAVDVEREASCRKGDGTIVQADGGGAPAQNSDRLQPGSLQASGRCVDA